MPWTNKNRSAKAIAFFATLLTVSIGLCGANFFAVIRFVPLAGPEPPPGTPTWPTTLLTVTGWVEIAGIAVGLCGLVISGIARVGETSRGKFGRMKLATRTKESLMFEPVEGTAKMGTGPKMMAICAVGLLLSLGLCGVGEAVHAWRVSNVLAGVGIFLFFGSLLGLFIGFCLTLIQMIAGPKG